MDETDIIESYKSILLNLKHSINRARKRMWIALEQKDAVIADRMTNAVNDLLGQYKLINGRITEIIRERGGSDVNKE